MMNTIKTYFNKSWIQYLLFWIGVFLFSIISSSQAAKMGIIQASEIYGTIVLCQFLAAVVCLNLLIPNFLNKGKTLLFILSISLLMLMLFALYINIRMNYLELKYFDYYHKVMPEYIQLGFWERLFDFRILLSKGLKYLSPTALILLVQYYKNQQEFLTLNEQKKTAELSALKNQLNPHFLFNTLNNLYSLAIVKSDKTPEVIGKLSDILDYMLYRCDEKYVWLNKEIEMIENYLTLEKMRYGKRVKVNFNTALNHDVKIAPLLLLTFIENAFKHGVREELGTATIDINLTAKENEILFDIKNTIPTAPLKDENREDTIGLKNVKKQLELLYPNQHELEINHHHPTYQVNLTLKTK